MRLLALNRSYAAALQLVTALAINLIIHPGVHAQVLYGSLVGNVTDSAGAAVPGAAVVLTNRATALVRRASSDNRGQYSFNDLQMGDVYVADGNGKVFEGTLIGSNLGSGIAAHTHSGFVFDAGIRDAEENREIANLNGLYRGYDPSFLIGMTMTAINAPVRIGHATVLPGDLVLAKRDGVIFIPAILAEEAISTAEFTKLQDEFNFELNRAGSNGGAFEGGWTNAKFDAFAKWIDAHTDKLKMPRSEFDALLKKHHRD